MLRRLKKAFDTKPESFKVEPEAPEADSVDVEAIPDQFPQMLYKDIDGVLRQSTVTNREERATWLADGWSENPSHLKG